MEKNGLAWTSSEVDCGVASTTVKTLTDVLWYVDGHHSKFSDRSCNLPSLFESFAGYNKPEMSNTERDQQQLSQVCGQCAPLVLVCVLYLALQLQK